jgi:uncharacterized protein involved in exopolysaccharide biosynthesis
MQKINSYSNDEIDLKEILNILWSGKKIIICLTSIFAAGSVIFALSLSNYYKSGSILYERGSSDVSSLSQYSGLASMAGISLPSSGGEKALKAIELIKSRQFVKHLLTFEDILPSVLAAKSYNSDTKKLLFNEDLYNAKSKKWIRETKKNQSQVPSYLEAHEVYLDMLSINQDKVTKFIYINFEHISPIFAKDFLDLIIRESNELIRKKEMEESAVGIEYLKSELLNTSFFRNP